MAFTLPLCCPAFLTTTFSSYVEPITSPDPDKCINKHHHRAVRTIITLFKRQSWVKTRPYAAILLRTSKNQKLAYDLYY